MKLSAEHKKAKELIQQIADLRDTSSISHNLKQESITGTRSGLLSFGVILMNFGFDNLQFTKQNNANMRHEQYLELMQSYEDCESGVYIDYIICSRKPEKQKPRHDSILDRIFLWIAMPILILLIISFVLFFTYQGIDFIIQGIKTVFQ